MSEDAQETAAPRPRRRLKARHIRRAATFLNSPFGLVVFTSILLGGISQLYTASSAYYGRIGTTRAELATLLVELDVRLLQLEPDHYSVRTPATTPNATPAPAPPATAAAPGPAAVAASGNAAVRQANAIERQYVRVDTPLSTIHSAILGSEGYEPSTPDFRNVHLLALLSRIDTTSGNYLLTRQFCTVVEGSNRRERASPREAAFALDTDWPNLEWRRRFVAVIDAYYQEQWARIRGRPDLPDNEPNRACLDNNVTVTPCRCP